MKNLKMKSSGAAKDLSQAELAAKVEVTRQTIDMIEAGDYIISRKLRMRRIKKLEQKYEEEGKE